MMVGGYDGYWSDYSLALEKRTRERKQKLERKRAAKWNAMKAAARGHGKARPA